MKRYEPCCEYIGSGEYVAAMARESDGDWVAYSDAARLQRARARNLVLVLRKMAERCLLEGDYAVAVRDIRWANAIEAKYR